MALKCKTSQFSSLVQGNVMCAGETNNADFFFFFFELGVYSPLHEQQVL